MKRIRVCGDFDDNAYTEILSRLPVKSLARFKCVCKRWQSLIRSDNYFIDLHLSRRSCPPTFLVIVRTDEEKTVVSVDLFNDIPVIRLPKQFPIELTTHERMLKPVNGLICSYLNDFLFGPTNVCIRNVMTGEQSPWIEVSIEELEKKNISSQTIEHGFGFDVTTKEHKVICIWQTIVELPGEISCLEDVVCKVMNVGRESYSAWRTIDDIPPYMVDVTSDGIFVHRSLYWLCRRSIPTTYCKNKPPTEYIGDFFHGIVAFDVTSEKFRSIPFPNYITEHPDSSEEDEFGLWRFLSILEVDGHIALTDQVNQQMVKLWIFDEDGDNHEKIATNATICSRDGNWIEETILMPPFGHSDGHQNYFFESIPSTNQLVIGMSTMVDTALYTLYLYDRINKTFVLVEISGMPINQFTQRDRMANFTESLIPVPKKQQQEYYYPLVS